MKKLLIIAATAAIVAGCGTTPGKVRDIGLGGMYINGYTETVAIGKGKLTSIPGEREALAAHYEEDVAWLSPQKKTHALDIFLVGSNAVAKADSIISSICRAFAEVAPTVSSNNVAATGSTAFDYLTAVHPDTSALPGVVQPAATNAAPSVETAAPSAGSAAPSAEGVN